MNIGGITSKLTSKADMIGFLAGVGLGTEAGTGAISEIFNNAMSGNIHFPDVQGLIQNWSQSSFFKNGVTGYIVGELVKAVNIMGTGKYGNALSKASVGYLKGGAVIQTAWYSTHSNEGSDPAQKNFNPNWNDNRKSIADLKAMPSLYAY